jgi:hypothetical protein
MIDVSFDRNRHGFDQNSGFQRSKETRFQDIPPMKAQDRNCNGRSYSADLAPLVQKYQTSYKAVE